LEALICDLQKMHGNKNQKKKDHYVGSISDWRHRVCMSVGEPWALSCRCMNRAGITARRFLTALHPYLEFQPHKFVATEDAAAIASLHFI
jgi:hypothetical protein